MQIKTNGKEESRMLILPSILKTAIAARMCFITSKTFKTIIKVYLLLSSLLFERSLCVGMNRVLEPQMILLLLDQSLAETSGI